jgi:hypothetical protein
MKNNKEHKNERLVSCYFITSRHLMLGKSGHSLTDKRSVLVYMKQLKSYQYKYNPACGGKTHFASAEDVARWNEEIQKELKK